MTICESVTGGFLRYLPHSEPWRLNCGLTCLCARLAFKPGLMQIRNVMQQDVSGKDVERVALYNFATDDVSPDSIFVEKYACRLSSIADQPTFGAPPDPSGALPEPRSPYSTCRR